MLTKVTSKNQITIPKKIMDQLPDVNYFEVDFEDGLVLMKPVRFYNTDLEKIRTKIKKLGLKDKTVAEAIRWARTR